MGYNLVIDTNNFKPYATFKDLVAPMVDYLARVDQTRELLDKYEDEYGDIIMPEGSKYKTTLDEYNLLLRSLADSMYNLPIELIMNRAHNIRNKYKNLILPIKTMMLEYNKDVDKVNTALMSNLNLYLGSPIKFEDYYGNNLPNIKLLNSKLIQLEAKDIVSNICALTTAKPEVIETMADLFYILKNLGSDSTLIMSAISLIGRDGNISTEDSLSIAQALNDLYSKYSEGSSDKAKSKILEDIRLGAILGIIPTTYEYLKLTQPRYREYLQTPTDRAEWEANKQGYVRVGDKWYKHVELEKGDFLDDFETDDNGNPIVYNSPGIRHTEKVVTPKGINIKVDGKDYYYDINDKFSTAIIVDQNNSYVTEVEIRKGENLGTTVTNAIKNVTSNSRSVSSTDKSPSSSTRSKSPSSNKTQGGSKGIPGSSGRK